MNDKIKEILYGLRKYDGIQQENERLKTKTKEQSLLLIDYQDMEQKLENYKSRIEKAVEYIENNSLYDEILDYDYEENPYILYTTDEYVKDNLLNILNGDK